MPPMGYDIGAIGDTATTTSALKASFLTTTTAGKPTCNITGVWANIGGNAMTTAGGGYMSGSSWQTVGTQTSTTVPNKKNNNNAAASTLCCVIGSPPGNTGAIGTGTQYMRISIGYAQTGGPGFWIATTPDMAWTIPNGGTATGYGDFLSRTASASMLINYQFEWFEA